MFGLTADDSPCVSDEELGTKKDASSCPLGIQHAATDHSAGGISIHSGIRTLAIMADSATDACEIKLYHDYTLCFKKTDP